LQVIHRPIIVRLGGTPETRPGAFLPLLGNKKASEDSRINRRRREETSVKFWSGQDNGLVCVL
jgi:hypothetical protein